MTLRRTLLVSSLAAAAVVATGATLAVESLRARDRVVSLERAAQAAIVQHSREACEANPDRKSTRLNSSHVSESRMPSSA